MKSIQITNFKSNKGFPIISLSVVDGLFPLLLFFIKQKRTMKNQNVTPPGNTNLQKIRTFDDSFKLTLGKGDLI